MLVTFSNAQKSSEAFSCYQMKKKFSKSTEAELDTRSDSIDIVHTSLNIDITNWAAKIIYANATINFKAKVSNVSKIALDLLVLQVDSVKQGSTSLNFTHNDTLLEIDLPITLAANQTSNLQIFYHGTPVQNAGDWGGFFWNTTYAFNIGVSFTEDPHNYGRAWFPCFDNFVERGTYEFFIRTNDTRKAFCNGILQSEIDNLDGTKTWHWSLGQEIPSYLASMTVADYATVNMTFNGVGANPIPIQLAARASDTTALKGSFVHLIDALDCFEENYAPYAFDRVGYCVTSFSAGAMEHATNITYMKNAVNGSTSNETLMAHELSHHWWGNLITCQTAEDMWLNEGWASFSEALFTEHVYGVDAYKDYSRDNHDNVLRLTHINDGAYYPVSGVPSDLTYSSTVYDKGADMAHTLRGILGDLSFQECIEGFLNDYAFKDVNSELFENYLSSCSGKDLSSFFETWIFEKGFHHYSLGEVNIEEQNGTFKVEGTVVQKLWENTIYTDFLPIEISFFDANFNETKKVITTYGACSSFQINLDFNPVFYALDLDEKIQDATVDISTFINQTGTQDLGLARLALNVNSIVDSVFVHAIHHYIKPDAFQNPRPGLHLSPNRYWSIGGVWNDDFSADATFKYNGSTSQNLGYLDNDFILNSEDSLVMMYKEKPTDDWSLVDSFTVFTQGNSMNKQGYIVVYDVKQGDYVMAIYDKNIADDESTFDACEYTGIYNVERMDKLVKIFPVPAKEYFQLNLLDDNKEMLNLKIVNILGKEVYSYRLKPNEQEHLITTKDWTKGAYIVSLSRKDQLVYSKKILID